MIESILFNPMLPLSLIDVAVLTAARKMKLSDVKTVLTCP